MDSDKKRSRGEGETCGDDSGGGARGRSGGTVPEGSPQGPRENTPLAETRAGTGTYSKEEIAALKSIFDLYDAEDTGMIPITELEGILQKLGHSAGESTDEAAE